MLTHRIKVRRKGQMTLPADVREDLELEEGDVVFLRKQNGQYTLSAGESWVTKTAGALASHTIGKPPITIEDMDRAVEKSVLEEWQRYVREIEEADAK